MPYKKENTLEYKLIEMGKGDNICKKKIEHRKLVHNRDVALSNHHTLSPNAILTTTPFTWYCTLDTYLIEQCLKGKSPTRGNKKKYQRNSPSREMPGSFGCHRASMLGSDGPLGERVVEQLVEHNIACETLWSFILPLMMTSLETFQGA